MQPNHIRRDQIPRRLPAVTGYELGNELLLYCADTLNVHVLNYSAAAVWDLCDGERSVLEINRELARVVGRSNAELFPDVQLAVNELMKMGVLGIAKPAPAERVRDGLVAPTGPALTVAFNGTAVRLLSDVEEVREHVAARFGRLPAGGHEDCVAELAVHAAGERFVLLGAPGDVYYAGALGDVLQELEMVLVQSLVDANPGLLWMHAGAVCRDGVAAMVVGPSGAGKSLFTTGLAAAGWRYLSDDVLPLNMDSGEVLPFPLAPSVRGDAEPHVPAHRLQTVQRTFVTLAEADVQQEPVWLGAVLLPRFDRRETARHAKPSAARVARVLIENTLNLERHRQQAVAYVCGLANALPALELRYGKRGAALDLASGKLAAGLERLRRRRLRSGAAP